MPNAAWSLEFQNESDPLSGVAPSRAVGRDVSPFPRRRDILDKRVLVGEFADGDEVAALCVGEHLLGRVRPLDGDEAILDCDYLDGLSAELGSVDLADCDFHLKPPTRER